ncbi:MAG TPA: RNA repair domain-containing protein, partial [Thermoplasmata archaeon]|nr:RNA repair domain-containing protein [Thermoplasmata archaeon]
RGRFPRTILAQCRWDRHLSLSEVEVEYVHRGAPGDRRRIAGDDIVSIGPVRFDLEDASIPYHRVTVITYGGRTVFAREPRALPAKAKKKTARKKIGR